MILSPKPVRSENEPFPAYFLRVHEWTELRKQEEAKYFRSCDSLVHRAPITNRAAITKQREHDHNVTIHDRARNSPLLARVLRELQKTHEHIPLK